MDCGWVGWCALSPNEQAAWLQAIGSLVLVGVAIVVPLCQRRSERRDRARRERRRARSLGTIVIRELRKLEHRLQDEIDRLAAAGDYEIVPVGGRAIPQLLWDNANELHLLGIPGDRTLQAIYEVFQAREHAFKFTSQASSLAVSPEDRIAYCKHLRAALEHIRVARDGVHELLSSSD